MSKLAVEDIHLTDDPHSRIPPHIRKVIDGSKVLFYTDHVPLVAGRDDYCQVAGIDPKYLMLSMKDYCHKDDVKWVHKFNTYRQKSSGAILFPMSKDGDYLKDRQRMCVMVAAFLRYYVDARLITVEDIFDREFSGRDATVLVISDFSLGDGIIRKDWEIRKMSSFLAKRRDRGLQTVLYVASNDKVTSEWGMSLCKSLKNYLSLGVALNGDKEKV